MALWWLDGKIKWQIMGYFSCAVNAYFDFVEIVAFVLQKGFQMGVILNFGL